MIKFINKYDLLKRSLNIGEVINSKIVKKITSSKAIADIKGFHVIVKSDLPLIENSSLSFLISGFNAKDKIILLKQLNRSDNKNVFNKLINLDNYVKKYLKQHKIPVNESTMRIAHYLYLKDKNISQDKLDFIFKYLKYFSDISLLYNLYKFNLDNKNLMVLLTLFQSFIKKSQMSFRKEKDENTDNNDILKKNILNGDKVEFLSHLKHLSNNKNLFNDLLQLNKNDYLPFYIYPLLVNSDSEIGYIFYLPYKNSNNLMKLNINFLDDVISFKLDFNFEETRINYNFFYFKKEARSLLIIDSNNLAVKQQIFSDLKKIKKRLTKLMHGELEILVKSDILLKNQYKENLDVYI